MTILKHQIVTLLGYLRGLQVGSNYTWVVVKSVIRFGVPLILGARKKRDPKRTIIRRPINPKPYEPCKPYERYPYKFCETLNAKIQTLLLQSPSNKIGYTLLFLLYRRKPTSLKLYYWPSKTRLAALNPKRELHPEALSLSLTGAQSMSGLSWHYSQLKAVARDHRTYRKSQLKSAVAL